MKTISVGELTKKIYKFLVSRGFGIEGAEEITATFPDVYDSEFLNEDYVGDEFVDGVEYIKRAAYFKHPWYNDSFRYYVYYCKADIPNSLVGEYKKAKKLYVVEDLDDADFPQGYDYQFTGSVKSPEEIYTKCLERFVSYTAKQGYAGKNLKPGIEVEKYKNAVAEAFVYCDGINDEYSHEGDNRYFRTMQMSFSAGYLFAGSNRDEDDIESTIEEWGNCEDAMDFYMDEPYGTVSNEMGQALRLSYSGVKDFFDKIWRIYQEETDCLLEVEDVEPYLIAGMEAAYMLGIHLKIAATRN